MFKKYVKDNRNVILKTAGFTILLYIIMILGNRVSIDTEVLLTDPEGQLFSWYGINRFGLGMFKKLFHLIPMNLLLTNIMTVILFILAAVLWNYSFVRIQKEQSTKANLVFLITLVSSPIFAEQFHFTLQSMEIAAALVLEAMAVILVCRWVENKGIYNAVIAVFLLTFCFSCYQAFVFLYVFACVLIYLIRQNEDEINMKEQIEEIIKYIFVLLAALVFYEILASAVKTKLEIATGTYLTDQIRWGKEPVLKTLFIVIAYVGMIMTGVYSSFHPFLPVLYCAFVFYEYKKWKKEGTVSFLKMVSMFLLILLPFILLLLMGSPTPSRAQFTVPMLLAWLAYYFTKTFETGKAVGWIKKCVAAMLVLQTVSTFALQVSAWNCYQKEKALASEVYSQTEDLLREGKKLVFIGKYNPNHMMKGNTIGRSFFEWDDDTPFGSNLRIHGFMQTQGMDYEAPTQEEYAFAKEYVKDLPVWSEEKTVYTEGNLVMIKLSNQMFDNSSQN